MGLYLLRWRRLRRVKNERIRCRGANKKRPWIETFVRNALFLPDGDYAPRLSSDKIRFLSRTSISRMNFLPETVKCKYRSRDISRAVTTFYSTQFSQLHVSISASEPYITFNGTTNRSKLSADFERVYTGS